MNDEEPICDFLKFKEALRNKGYTIGEAQPYVPLQVADVSFSNIRSGEIDIEDGGIYYIDPHTGRKHQIFLYMRNYDMESWGKPRFHIRNCQTIQELGTKKYRRANTGTVMVFDTSKNEDVEVSGLPLCKNCLSIIRSEMQLGYGRDMTSNEFEEILRMAGENTDTEENIDTDIEGYIWKWQKVSEAYRTKKKYTCEICGFTPNSKLERRYIHVHHKDGNKTNNRESNLQCLCIACHSNVNTSHKENFYKGANKVTLDAFKKKYPNAGQDKNTPTIDIDLPF